MQVQCPSCHARFILPEGVKEGALLRCSKCKEVFPLTSPEEAPAEAPETRAAPEASMPKEEALPKLQAQKKKRGGNLWLVLVLLLVAGFVVAYQTMPEFRDQVEAIKKQIIEKNAGEGKASSAKNEPKTEDVLVLQDISQYFLDNNKLGKLLVIEGYVVNMDDKPYKNIYVEGAVMKDGKNFATRQQKAGVKLARTQLSVMTEAEINAALSDEKEIVVTNGHVPPQGRVPFTMVYPVNNVTVDEYAVKVGASEPVVPADKKAEAQAREQAEGQPEGDSQEQAAPAGEEGLEGTQDPAAPDLSLPPLPSPEDALPEKAAPKADPETAPESAPEAIEPAPVAPDAEAARS